MRLVKKTAGRLLLALALAACAAPENEGPVDAGEAANCPEGQVAGPLGTCVVQGEQDGGDGRCADTCATDEDCTGGGRCGRSENGCTVCRRDCEPNDCHVAADCCNGAFCSPVESPLPPCGMCRPIEDECDETRACAAGSLCVYVAVPCSCSGGARQCLPDCRLGACGTDEVCDEGVCRPKRCTEGFACAAHATCAFPEGDARGCRRNDCGQDADCAGGRCVNGLCSRAIGFCELPRP